MHIWIKCGSVRCLRCGPKNGTKISLALYLLLHDSVTQNTYDFSFRFWGQFAVYLKCLGLDRCMGFIVLYANT